MHTTSNKINFCNSSGNHKRYSRCFFKESWERHRAEGENRPLWEKYHHRENISFGRYQSTGLCIFFSGIRGSCTHSDSTYVHEVSEDISTHSIEELRTKLQEKINCQNDISSISENWISLNCKRLSLVGGTTLWKLGRWTPFDQNSSEGNAHYYPAPGNVWKEKCCWAISAWYISSNELI